MYGNTRINRIQDFDVALRGSHQAARAEAGFPSTSRLLISRRYSGFTRVITWSGPCKKSEKRPEPAAGLSRSLDPFREYRLLRRILFPVVSEHTTRVPRTLPPASHTGAVTKGPVNIFQLAVTIDRNQLVFAPVGLPAQHDVFDQRTDDRPYFRPTFLASLAEG